MYTETPSAESLRLAGTYGMEARALIYAPFPNSEGATVDECGTLIYWRARLAARHAANYLGIVPQIVRTVTHYFDFNADREWLIIELSDGDRYECDVYPYCAEWGMAPTSDPTHTNHRIAMQQFPAWRPVK